MPSRTSTRPRRLRSPGRVRVRPRDACSDACIMRIYSVVSVCWTYATYRQGLSGSDDGGRRPDTCSTAAGYAATGPGRRGGLWCGWAQAGAAAAASYTPRVGCGDPGRPAARKRHIRGQRSKAAQDTHLVYTRPVFYTPDRPLHTTRHAVLLRQAQDRLAQAPRAEQASGAPEAGGADNVYPAAPRRKCLSVAALRGAVVLTSASPQTTNDPQDLQPREPGIVSGEQLAQGPGPVIPTAQMLDNIGEPKVRTGV